MESQSQNLPALAGSSGQAKSGQAKSTPARETASKTSQEVPKTDNNGQELISGLNAASSRQPLEQTLGQIELLGEGNSQTGATNQANTTPGSQTVASADQSTSGAGAASSSAGRREAPEWQKNLQASLQQGWTGIAKRVKTASPTQIALGVAAVGAAVWLGTRKRTPKASKDKTQSAADRWLDYPTSTAGSRSEEKYTPYGHTSAPARSQSQPGQASASGESHTPKGAATGRHDQSNETWQRPTDERWSE